MTVQFTAPDLTGLNIERVETLLIPWLEDKSHRKGTEFLCRIENGNVDDVTEGEAFFCCLGGASEAAIPALGDIRVPVTRFENGFDGDILVHYGTQDQELLSAVMQEYYGFNDTNPYIQRRDGGWMPAAEWNDWGQEGSIDVEGEDGYADDTQKNPDADFGPITEGFRRMVAEAKRQRAALGQPPV